MYKEHIGKTEIMFWVYGQQEQEAHQISKKKRPRSPGTGDSPTHSKRKSKSDVITHKLMKVDVIAVKLRNIKANSQLSKLMCGLISLT